MIPEDKDDQLLEFFAVAKGLMTMETYEARWGKGRFVTEEELFALFEDNIEEEIKEARAELLANDKYDLYSGRWVSREELSNISENIEN